MSALKNLAKSAIGSMASRTPARLRHIAMERFCQQGDDQEAADLVARLAPLLGISAVVARGEYGVIQSAPNDTVVFGQYAKHGIWAKHTNQIFIKFFRERGGGTYVDIGANIGLTTIPVAQNDKVNCIAFEPDPVNFANLKVNVRNNCPHRNVKMESLALCEKRCTLSFELADRNLGDHRMASRNGAATERRVIKVPGAPLDEQIDDLHGPLAVKCDTQGAEPFVIAGGQKVLSQANLVVLEFWPHGMIRMGGDPGTVIDFLAEFERVTILPKEDKGAAMPSSAPDSAATLREFVERYHDTPTEYCDVVAERR
jgi:FkbM family methyltransferase